MVNSFRKEFTPVRRVLQEEFAPKSRPILEGPCCLGKQKGSKLQWQINMDGTNTP